MSSYLFRTWKSLNIGHSKHDEVNRRYNRVDVATTRGTLFVLVRNDFHSHVLYDVMFRQIKCGLRYPCRRLLGCKRQYPYRLLSQGSMSNNSTGRCVCQWLWSWTCASSLPGCDKTPDSTCQCSWHNHMCSCCSCCKCCSCCVNGETPDTWGATGPTTVITQDVRNQGSTGPTAVITQDVRNQEVIKKLEQKITDIKKSLDQEKNDKEKAEKDYMYQKSEVQVYQEKLSSKELDLVKARDEYGQMQNRYSELCSKQLQANNTDIEDMMDTERPSKVAEGIRHQLYSNDWCGPYNDFSDLAVSEDDILHILCDTLVEAYKFCQGKFELQKLNLVFPGMAVCPDKSDEACDDDDVLNNEMTTLKSSLKKFKQKTITHLHKEFMKDIKKHLPRLIKIEIACIQKKEESDTASDEFSNLATERVGDSGSFSPVDVHAGDITPVETTVSIDINEGASESGIGVEITETAIDESIELTKTASIISPYALECIRYCWKMVLTDPSMALVYDIKEGSTIDRIRFDTYCTEGTFVEFVVWPAVLRQDHGESIMEKGVVKPLPRSS